MGEEKNRISELLKLDDEINELVKKRDILREIIKDSKDNNQ